MAECASLELAEQWEKSVWNYTYEEDWYLCKQNTELKTKKRHLMMFIINYLNL